MTFPIRSASTDLFAAAQRLQARGHPFALVSVVRVEAPTSAREGDKALVTGDGHIDGWIGGGCAQPVVIRVVRQALDDGRARVVRIAPAANSQERDLGDILEFGMACHSGGTIELFVDPILPPARLVIVGDSPVAVALAALASRVGLRIGVIAHQADRELFPDASEVLASDDAEVVAAGVGPGAFVVVATQGRRDLQGLRAALASRARRIFFVASARKAEVLRASLVEGGEDARAVAEIVAPAGESIGAQTPEEIALSVLAAVVAARRRPHGCDAAAREGPAGAERSDAPTPRTEVPAGASPCCAGTRARPTERREPASLVGQPIR